MDTNTLLNIYQSYTLTKVSEINKQSLIAAYAQNEQLNKLNKELSRANRTSDQILRNQIKEIELREKQRYYKNLTFNLSQVMTSLENEDNVNFRIFASGLFLSPVCNMAKDAIQELDEIADKEYAQNIIKRAHSLSDNDKAYIESYQDTPWATFLDIKSQLSDFTHKNKRIIRRLTAKYEDVQKNYEELVDKDACIKKKMEKAKVPVSAKEAESNKKGCVGCSLTTIILLIILVIYLYLNNHHLLVHSAVLFSITCLISGASYFYYEKVGWEKFADKDLELKKLNVASEKIEKEKTFQKANLETISNELSNLQQEETRLTTQYNELLQGVTLDCPKWEDKLNNIAEILPHGKKKDNKRPKDILLFDAAKFLVSIQQGSTSLIQRKFSIGYNRANKIMDQLEAFGVVGPANGSNPREVLFESEEELLEIQKEMES